MMEIIYLGSFIGLVFTALGPKGDTIQKISYRRDLFQISSFYSRKLHKTVHLPNFKHSLDRAPWATLQPLRPVPGEEGAPERPEAGRRA